MNKKLLTIGGIVNTLFMVFHVYLAWVIQVSPELSTEAKGLIHAFNIFGTVVIGYFAYVSFFHRHEMLTTRLGKSIIVLVSVIYLSRAVEEFFLFEFSPVIFVSCTLLGGLYAALVYILPSRSAVAVS